MLERWAALCRRVGSHDDPELLYLCIAGLYATPPRPYHTLAHVAACLQVLDAAPAPAAGRDAVELALWLHDAVYIPGRPDNEERSAAVAAMFARELRCGEAFIGRVRACILATRHGGSPQTDEERLTADIDLSVLGAAPERYRDYAAAIREEYAFVSEERFNEGRRAFLSSMLARERIYALAWFRERVEARARLNMADELRGLERPGV